MDLTNLVRPAGLKRRKRVGRGESSGLGKTSGKGHKGQRARSGFSVSPGFEGGQMPLQRRLPKKGFVNPSRVRYNVINIKDLARLDPGNTVTVELLRQVGLVKRSGPVKLLSQGDVAAAFRIKLDRISTAAKSKIEAAGGVVE
jgi:large subunit ribosomal protein L15